MKPEKVDLIAHVEASKGRLGIGISHSDCCALALLLGRKQNYMKKEKKIIKRGRQKVSRGGREGPSSTALVRRSLRRTVSSAVFSSMNADANCLGLGKMFFTAVAILRKRTHQLEQNADRKED